MFYYTFFKPFANEKTSSEHWPKWFYLVVPPGSSPSNNHSELLHLFLLSSSCFSLESLFSIKTFEFLFGNTRRIAQPYLQKFDSTTRTRGLETRRTLNYHVKFTCYCILTKCSGPIRCFKIILMYNKYISSL